MRRRRYHSAPHAITLDNNNNNMRTVINIGHQVSDIMDTITSQLKITRDAIVKHSKKQDGERDEDEMISDDDDGGAQMGDAAQRCTAAHAQGYTVTKLANSIIHPRLENVHPCKKCRQNQHKINNKLMGRIVHAIQAIDESRFGSARMLLCATLIVLKEQQKRIENGEDEMALEQWFKANDDQIKEVASLSANSNGSMDVFVESDGFECSRLGSRLREGGNNGRSKTSRVSEVLDNVKCIRLFPQSVS